MDDQRNVRELIQIICRLYGGSVQLSELADALGKVKCTEYFAGTKPEIYFLQSSNMFTLEREGSSFVVGVKTPLSLCPAYRSKVGCQKQSCTNLHVCKQFIMGTCPFGDASAATTARKCHHSHQLQGDPHNKGVLLANQMAFLDPVDLKFLIRQGDVREFSPGLCRDYSNPSGCKRGDKCYYLHLCRTFVTGRAPCKFGKKCKFGHYVFATQPKRILRRFAIDTTKSPNEILGIIRKGLTAPRKTGDTERRASEKDEDDDVETDEGDEPGLEEYGMDALSLDDECLSGIQTEKLESGDHELTTRIYTDPSTETESERQKKKGKRQKQRKQGNQQAVITVASALSESAEPGDDLSVPFSVEETVESQDTVQTSTDADCGELLEVADENEKEASDDSDIFYEDSTDKEDDTDEDDEFEEGQEEEEEEEEEEGEEEVDEMEVVVEGAVMDVSGKEIYEEFKEDDEGEPEVEDEEKKKSNRRNRRQRNKRVLEQSNLNVDSCTALVTDQSSCSVISSAKEDTNKQTKKGKGRQRGNSAKSRAPAAGDQRVGVCESRDEGKMVAGVGNRGENKAAKKQKGKNKRKQNATNPSNATPDQSDTLHKSLQQVDVVGGKNKGNKGNKAQQPANPGKKGKAKDVQAKPQQRRPSASGASEGATSNKDGAKGERVKGPSGGAVPKKYQAPDHSDDKTKSQAPQQNPKQTSTTKEGKKDDTICLYFLDGKCRKGEECNQHHNHLPYFWQKLASKDNWKTLPGNLSGHLEKEFCDVDKEKIQISLDGTNKSIADFNKMVLIDLGEKKVVELRRISTYPYATVKPLNKLAVEWIWYWKDGAVWRQYGAQGGIGSASVRSSEIEVSYQLFMRKGEPVSIQFSVGLENEYTIHFGQMTQQNQKTSVKREVRRRPKYLSANDVKAIKAERKKSAAPKPAKKSAIPPITANPKHWDRSAADKGGYGLISLSDNGNTKAEYQEIAARFQETMPDDLIVSIERVQNDSLWGFLTKRHETMKQKTGDVDVRHLFHGTPEQYVHVICRQNFDWRLSGSRVGRKYGSGSYFAKTAKFSDSYIATDDLYRKMFFARVLVGDYAQGKQDYVRPPPKNVNDPFGDIYDSCVDKVDNPKIFVIFETSQVYPEYVITYIKQDDIERM